MEIENVLKTIAVDKLGGCKFDALLNYTPPWIEIRNKESMENEDEQGNLRQGHLIFYSNLILNSVS